MTDNPVETSRGGHNTYMDHKSYMEHMKDEKNHHYAHEKHMSDSGLSDEEKEHGKIIGLTKGFDNIYANRLPHTYKDLEASHHREAAEIHQAQANKHYNQRNGKTILSDEWEKEKNSQFHHNKMSDLHSKYADHLDAHKKYLEAIK